MYVNLCRITQSLHVLSFMHSYTHKLGPYRYLQVNALILFLTIACIFAFAIVNITHTNYTSTPSLSHHAGSPPIDTICVYHYQWCDVTIDILTRIDKVTLIPIKNVYNRAIPGLKQNVLSARISKLGIRSLVLPEPYVSTLKKLNMGLTGSSHYITISDFVKICTYFRHPPPKNIVKFDFITSAISSEEVVKIFNDPSNEASQKLLSQLSAEAEVKGLNSSSGSGSKCGSAGTSGRGNKRKESEGSSIAMDETYNPSEGTVTHTGIIHVHVLRHCNQCLHVAHVIRPV